jgi:hypothetical protein
VIRLLVLAALTITLTLPCAAQQFGGTKPGEPVVEFLNRINLTYTRSQVIASSAEEPCHFRITWQDPDKPKQPPVVVDAWAEHIVYDYETGSATATGKLRLESGEYVVLGEVAHMIRSASEIVIPASATYIQRLAGNRCNFITGKHTRIKWNKDGVTDVQVKDMTKARAYITRTEANELLRKSGW